MGRSKDLATGTFTDGLTVDTSDQVIINHSGDAGGLRIDSTNNTNTGSIRFGDVADNYIGAVEYNHTSDALSFYANNATRMTINSSGYVTMPNQPAILASSSTDQTFSSTATATAMTLGTTNFSRGNLTRSGNNLTVPVTGYYIFNYAIAANVKNDIRAFGVRLYQNGSSLQGHNYHAAYHHSGSSFTHYEFTGTFLVSLSASDYVTLYGILYDTTSNINFETQINGYLLG